MDQFTKVYARILDSTLWEAIPEARLVFLGMTFASDLDGNLMTRTTSALARRLNLSEEYVKKGLEVITAPDPHSANKAFEGRRVLPIEGGWFVVSKRACVDKQNSKQAEWAEKKARYRASKKAKPAAPLPDRNGGHKAHSLPMQSDHEKQMIREAQDAIGEATRGPGDLASEPWEDSR